MRRLRPTDLALEHGLSTQAIRNYEHNGCLPPADRTPTGYRIYTDIHAAALRAFLALIGGFGHSSARAIMLAVHQNDIDEALALIDAGHYQLLADRRTLDRVRHAVDHLAASIGGGIDENDKDSFVGGRVRAIGELAHVLRVSPATLRTWERVGILSPQRNRMTGYRIYCDEDIRDAELAHLLRRGGYLLAQIAVVIGQIRAAGGTEELKATMDHWQDKLRGRGMAMLKASGALSEYLGLTFQIPPQGFSFASD